MELALLSGAENLRRLIVMRWFAVAGELLAIAAVQPLTGIALPYTPMLTIVALQASFNALTLLRLRRPEPVRERELFAQLLVDLTALTVLLFFSGGAANPFVSLFLPPVAVAAAVLPGRYAWAVALCSVAAYSLLSTTNVPLILADFERATRLHLAGMWITFVASALMIAWFVARMTQAVRSRDAQLAAAREEALRNERVVALGSLAAGAAHELGTPLATVAVLAGELAKRTDLPQDVRQDLELLQQQVAQCKSIITGLAQRAGQARAEGGRAVSLDRWLEGIIGRWRDLRPQCSPRVSLDGPRPAPLVAGEATLEQAFANLFNNAADACPGHVEIEASWDDSRLVVDVRDRGPGFDDQVLLAAGRAFVTTRDQGTGIGLFLAHAAVERFGGRLSLANRAGGGALTRVELPLARLLTEAP
jgi:two-component system sensor histidine kinase RegB